MIGFLNLNNGFNNTPLWKSTFRLSYFFKIFLNVNQQLTLVWKGCLRSRGIFNFLPRRSQKPSLVVLWAHSFLLCSGDIFNFLLNNFQFQGLFTFNWLRAQRLLVTQSLAYLFQQQIRYVYRIDNFVWDKFRTNRILYGFNV